MALLVSDVECPCCHQRHNFGLDCDRWKPGAPYEYVCPQTAQPAALCIPETSLVEGTVHWPQGAVKLTMKR